MHSLFSRTLLLSNDTSLGARYIRQCEGHADLPEFRTETSWKKRLTTSEILRKISVGNSKSPFPNAVPLHKNSPPEE